uniref:Nucleoside diphosphate kinase n=1 Tax=Panagrellus redivivus TaxID=6233 RepID=A0A7E4ZVW0_PANRE
MVPGRQTLAIIKPDAVSHPILLKHIGEAIIAKGFLVKRACRVRLTLAEAKELYSVHLGKFFYERLVRHMASGPVLAMQLESTTTSDAIAAWRALLGPSKLYANLIAHSTIPIDQRPLRQQFALSDTRNMAHGSDSPDEVTREMAVFEPYLQPVTDQSQLFRLPPSILSTDTD